MKMRCITIDDEPLALAQMVKYIEKTPVLTLVGSFRRATEAFDWLERHEADLIFVDINMPGMNGVDFVKSLQKKLLIVFTTAYSEFALEGFRVDAIDYLLKPIGYSDFTHSVEKAYRQYQLLAASRLQELEDRVIFVRSAYKKVPIGLKGILFVESRSEYVRIVSEEGRPVMTLGSMKSYEEKLPADMFMRVHRSYIVNLHKIRAVERKQLVFVNGAHVPIGELYEERLREYIASRLHQ